MSEPSEKDLEKAREMINKCDGVDLGECAPWVLGEADIESLENSIAQALADARAETDKENEELRIQNNLYADEFEKLKIESERRIEELEQKLIQDSPLKEYYTKQITALETENSALRIERDKLWDELMEYQKENRRLKNG